jgi:hypothetical protein
MENIKTALLFSLITAYNIINKTYSVVIGARGILSDNPSSTART